MREGRWIYGRHHSENMHRSRNGFSSIHNRLLYTFHHTLHFRIQSRSSSQYGSRMRQPSFTSEWKTDKIDTAAIQGWIQQSLWFPCCPASDGIACAVAEVLWPDPARWRHNPSYLPSVDFLFFGVLLIICLTMPIIFSVLKNWAHYSN